MQTEGFGEGTLRTWHQEESRVTRCARWTTPAKTVKRRRISRQSESTNGSSMCVCHCRFWKRPSQVIKLAPHEHAQIGPENDAQDSEKSQLQFINKVGDDRVKLQRQVPQSKRRGDEAVEISRNSVQRQNRGFQLSNREQMPQEQFQRVKQNQNPSPESSQEDRESTVTAHTRNEAIRNQTHGAGKDLQRARYSQAGCCQDCQRSSQRSRRQWRCRRKPNTAEVTEISRPTSIWHEKHPSVKDPGAQA